MCYLSSVCSCFVNNVFQISVDGKPQVNHIPHIGTSGYQMYKYWTVRNILLLDSKNTLSVVTTTSAPNPASINIRV